jgi:hypothetical protein
MCRAYCKLIILSCVGMTIDRCLDWQLDIELLQDVTTNKYDSLTKFHTPKITVTTAYVKSSQSSLAAAW